MSNTTRRMQAALQPTTHDDTMPASKSAEAQRQDTQQAAAAGQAPSAAAVEALGANAAAAFAPYYVSDITPSNDGLGDQIFSGILYGPVGVEASWSVDAMGRTDQWSFTVAEEERRFVAFARAFYERTEGPTAGADDDSVVEVVLGELIASGVDHFERVALARAGVAICDPADRAEVILVRVADTEENRARVLARRPGWVCINAELGLPCVA